MGSQDGRGRHRRSRRAAEARRRDVRQAAALDAHLVHGRDPAHGRHRQRARLLHAAARHRQRRRTRHRRQHLPRPHQRAGRDGSRPRCRHAAALLRPRRRRLAPLVARLGGGVRVARQPLRQAGRAQQHHDQLPHHAGHPVDPLVRCGDAAEGAGRPEGQPQGGDHLRPRRQHRAAHAGDAEGPRRARSAGDRGPASDQLRLARQTARTAPTCCRSRPSSSARLAHGVQPLAAVGREDRRADLRERQRLLGDVRAGQAARLRRPGCSRTSSWSRASSATSRRPSQSCARSIAAAGRPATAASLPSGSRRT